MGFLLLLPLYCSPFSASDRLSTCCISRTKTGLLQSPPQNITFNMGSKADIRLDGKVALITGAGRGLGAGFAKMLAERGAAVILNYATSAKPALATVAEIEKVFEEAIKAFGKLDIVINNAGMEHFGKTQDVTEEEFDAVFGLNTRAQFFVGSRALRHLSDGGRIIFMSSIAASLSVPNHALYCASKSAAEGLARSFAADGGPRRITCNAIAPGGIKTDMFAQNAWHYSPGAPRRPRLRRSRLALPS